LHRRRNAAPAPGAITGAHQHHAHSAFLLSTRLPTSLDKRRAPSASRRPASPASVPGVRRHYEVNMMATAGVNVARQTGQYHERLRELRKLAAWYREFAERAGNPAIWESRLRTAAELGREADRLEAGRMPRPRPKPGRP
jgi:hypothetical protein